MKNYMVNVFLRKGELFVGVSLPAKVGFQSLDFVLRPEGAWDGLAASLAEAERRALEALKLPVGKRPFDKGEAVVKAAECKSYSEFVRGGAVACFLYRSKKECVAELWLPDARHAGFEKSNVEEPCDPAAPIQDLAPLVRRVLEGAGH